MPLPLALVFHFNQHTTEYADIANRTCYLGLVKVLRAHPQFKFNLHLSGTLLRALRWFDTDTLALIRAGVAEGQFELLGSTYAQNVPYACDDWDNAQHLGLHRAILAELFEVKPTAFWNSERCWRQSLAPVITEGGYTVTLAEDHILHAAGVADPVPVRTDGLTVVCDDTLLRNRFNYAAWFGRSGQLLDYLKRLAARPGAENFLVAYAEDAEAMGLWGWQQGYVPNATWAHLDALLTELETSGLVELRLLSSAQAQQTVAALPNGAAQWMDLALLNPHAPYHEDDFSDWFDFNNRSQKLSYFRKLYAILRTRLQTLGSVRSDPGFARAPQTAGDVFYRQAIEAFCHHQYEFGCIGVGGRKYWGWENVRSAFLFAAVAEMADEPEAYNWIEDVTGDGSDEQILCDSKQMAVLTGYGGRLLYWFDVAEGRQWAGNQLAIPPAPYEERSTKAPDLKPHARYWLPTTTDADLKPLKAYREKERPPTAMSRHLPAWVFERDVPALTVYRRKTRQPGQRWPLRAQFGIFNDTVSVNGGAACTADELLDYRFEQGGVVCYLMFPTPEVFIEKRVRQTAEGMTVTYALDNRADAACRVRLISSNELNPDYAVVLTHGRAALEYAIAERRVSVVNTVTRNALVLETSRAWAKLDRVPGLLALEARLTFDFDLAPRAQDTFELHLKIQRLSESTNR